MKRNIYKKLLFWKSNKHKKPLIIKGKRQVGKTYIVLKFAKKEYKEDYVYINFLQEPLIFKIFQDGLIPKKVLDNISILKNKKINKNTLIIFDEVQESMEAINFLKFLNESSYDNNLIATGSWIDAAINKYQGNFPVGQVELLTMHPMSIDEFTNAISGNSKLIDEVKFCFDQKKPINDLLHKKMMDIYHEYLIVGGMPEIVDFYIKNKHNQSIIDLDNNLKRMIFNLRSGYLSDLSKYSSNINLIKINQIYDSLSNILGQDFNKFKYQLIDPRRKTQARDWSISVDILNLTRITIPIYHLQKITPVIEGAYYHKNFKLYYSDIGFLVEKTKINRLTINEETFSYKGWITENFVAIHLNMYYEKLFYWFNQPNEIDFVIQNNDNIIPIDVKSGRRKKSSSMKKYIEFYKPKIAVIVSKDNFNFDKSIVNIPVYAIYLINKLM